MIARIYLWAQSFLASGFPLAIFHWAVSRSFGWPRFKMCDSETYVVDGVEIHPRRYHLYRDGRESRFDLLLRQYALPFSEIPHGAVVFDVGANIGEFGIAVKNKYDRGGDKNLRIVSFEPIALEFRLLLRNYEKYGIINSEKGECWKIALFSEDRALSLFVSHANADNSVFDFPGSEGVEIVEARRGTHYMDKFTEIFLLKVEAEGAEPEVLEGFGEALGKCQWIVVDAGFERNGNYSTLPQVCEILKDTHEFVSVAPGRLCSLFKRR